MNSFALALFLVVGREDAFFAFRAFVVLEAFVDVLLRLAFEFGAAALVFPGFRLFARTAFQRRFGRRRRTRLRNAKLLHESGLLLTGFSLPRTGKAHLRAEKEHLDSYEYCFTIFRCEFASLREAL